MTKQLLIAVATISFLMVGCSDSSSTGPQPQPKRKEAKIEAQELEKIKALSDSMHPQRILVEFYRKAIVTQQPKRAELYATEALEAGATEAQIKDYELRIKTDLRAFIDQCEGFLAQKDIQNIKATLDFAALRGYEDFAYYQDSFMPRAQKILEDYANGK